MNNREINFFRFLACYHSAHHPLEAIFRRLAAGDIKRFLRTAARLDREHSNHIFSVNLHFPLCVSRCAYCTYNHQRIKRQHQLNSYYALMLSEIKKFASFYPGTFNQVNFEGGSPALFAGTTLGKILRTLHRSFTIGRNALCRFEADPFLINSEKLTILKGEGVNYISLGVQSLDDTVLNALRRPQTKRMIFDVAKAIRSVQFPYLNIDVLAGIPFQAPSSFISGMHEVIAMGSEFITVYPFLPFYTPLRRHCTSRTFLAKRREMITHAHTLLVRNGYVTKNHLEFKRKDVRLPWVSKAKEMFFSTLGLGTSATSHLYGTALYSTTKNTRGIIEYRGLPLSPHIEMALYMAERLAQGVSLSEFKRRFKRDCCRVFERELGQLAEKGLIRKDGNTLSYRAITNQKERFEYEAMTKIFLKDTVIQKLLKAFKNTYKPDTAYTYARHGIWKNFYDLDFVLRLEKQKNISTAIRIKEAPYASLR